MVRLLVTSALVSSLLIGNMVRADNPVSALEDDWASVSRAGPTLKGWDEIDKHQQIVRTQENAYKAAGGEGTLYPEAPGARLQKAGRLARASLGKAWDIATPFIFTGIVRVAGDVALGIVTPLIAEDAGKVAAKVASEASSWLTRLDPTGTADKVIRKTAAVAAEGEVYRDMGTVAYYVQTYTVPVFQTVYKAGVATIQGVKKTAEYATSYVQSAYSWGKSWFTQPAKEDATTAI